MSKMNTVKLLIKGNQKNAAPIWLRQIPADGIWKNCRFVMDGDCADYDWLVVYDDLPTTSEQRFSTTVEKLACPRERTIFVTAEPDSIKTYGYDFLNQFGTILSCQKKGTSPERKTRRTICGLRWFYGVPFKNVEAVSSYDQMKAYEPTEKTETLSTLCSMKAMTHTLHALRVQFTLALAEELPGMEIFGFGRRFLNDKKDALDPYRYHVAMENTIADNYITEKLTDAFLGLSLPFYVGAPNAGDYFPKDSFIAIDPNDPKGAAKIIRDAIDNNEWEKRLPALREARRLVMEKYNLFAIVADLVAEKETQTVSNAPYGVIRSRRAVLMNPVRAARFGFEKIRERLRSA
jgi:hypothetical protein